MAKPPVRLPLGARVQDIVERQIASGERKPPSPAKLREQAEARTLIHASINIPNPPGSKLIQSLDQDFEHAPMDLPVMAILFYDGNPRTEVNPEFEAIKESIRECGRIKQPITITRRPGRTEYMLAAGGNTRLKAIQELWLETNEPQFEKTTCLFVTWRGEVQILADHLIENEVRGEMTFWDKAVALSKLRKQIEEEDGEAQSSREFETRLKSIGLPVSKTLIAYYTFATDALVPLGNMVALPSVKHIQPAFGALRKFASKHGISEPEISALFTKTISKCAVEAHEIGTLDSTRVVVQLETALAEQLGLDQAQFGALMMANNQFPALSVGELKATVLSTSAKLDEQPFPGDRTADVSSTFAELSTPETNSQPHIEVPPVFNNPPPIPNAVVQRTFPALGIVKSREQLLLEKTDAFKKACEAYAIKHAVVAQFVAEPNMPMGFYMEFPASSMLGLPNAKSRILAWWFLASVTMQRDASIVTECIPEERKSEARKSVVRMEQDAQSGSADDQPDSLTAALFGANAPYWDLGDLLHPDFNAMRACLPLVMMYHDVVEVMRSEPGQEVSN